MAALEARLDRAEFVRIHRSRIVRLDQVVELQTIDNGDYLVRLKDGSEHRASRTYADGLAAWLKDRR